MRLAWFSPMPPVRSGIATCSAELVARLGTEHQIDVFVDQPVRAGAGELPPLRSAHDFVWLHRQRPYDLTVFQVGNSSHHDFIWPYLFRFPGLVVLHDAHLHHARAAQLLRERRADDYRAEFAANEPDAGADAAELAIAGFDSFLHYEWPFTRLVCSCARLAAVHSRLMCDELRERVGTTRIEHLRLGHGTLVPAAEASERGARARRELAIGRDAVVFGGFGGVTPEKRVPQILDAYAALLRYSPGARLLLAGPHADHYDVRADVARRNMESRVIVAGYVDGDELLTDYICACDVTLNLRWPTAREISGPWLRCLAAGRATIVLDLRHTSDLPALDPRTWSVAAGTDGPPVAVAIDVLDEDHSLQLAMRRLTDDAPLREQLGIAARDYWIREHSHQAMLEDYRRLLADAALSPPPPAALPPHALRDGSGPAAGILRRFGRSLPWSNI